MSDPTNGEFTGIFHPGEGRRAPMSNPTAVKATKKFALYVRDNLNIPEERMYEAADWVANLMERYGAYFAQPMFDMEGNGPKCSFCGMIWPLCGHHHMTGINLENDDKDGAE